MKVIKRDGSVATFDAIKIYNAIMKAMKYGSGVVDEVIAHKIAAEIELNFEKLHKDPTIFQIETYVYLKLIENGHELTAKAYEGYRAIQAFKRGRACYHDRAGTDRLPFCRFRDRVR